MNPIERALANADRIIAANRKLEELSRPTPPPVQRRPVQPWEYLQAN